MEKFLKNTLTLCLLAMALALASCSKHNSDEPAPPEPEHTPAPVAEPVRTVLVYMIAANNLNVYANYDIKEMRQAVANGDADNGNLLIYKVSYNNSPELLKVTADGLETLKEYDPNTESLTIAHMRQVVEDMKELAPAKEYGLVLWGHASGWYENGIEDEDASRADRPLLYSYGCDKSNGTTVWMNSASLGAALRGEDLAFVYFDCCFMGGVEVLYEMRGVAPYIVASPTEIKAEGMPYQLNVKVFFEENLNIAEAAQNYYKYYEDIYQEGKDDGCPYAIAVYDMSHLDDLAAVTRRLYEASSIAVPVGYSVQQFGVDMNGYQNSFYDFEDYVTALLGKTHPLVVDWKNIMDQLIVYKATSRAIWGTPIDKYCGLSTYIIKGGGDPNLTNKKQYESLQWYADVASAIIK